MSATPFDQSIPVLDAWSEHELGFEVNSVSGGYAGGYTGTISGYCWTCIPFARGVATALTGYVPADFKGKNKLLQLACIIQQELGTTVTALFDFDSDGLITLTLTFSGKVTFMYATSNVRRKRIDARNLGVVSTAADGTQMSFTGSMTFKRPAGTWAPMHNTWTVTADRQPLYRITASPYNHRYETRRYWGMSQFVTLSLLLVPYADIERSRAFDVPCTGWAAVANRQVGRAGLSTLEGILPWLASAEPTHTGVEQGGGVRTWGVRPGSRRAEQYVPAMGRPTILYLQRDLIGQGYAFGQGSTIFESGVPYGNNPMRYDDTLARHVTLVDGVTLESCKINDPVPNRYYDIAIPFRDVTPMTVIPVEVGTDFGANSLRYGPDR